MTVQPAGIAMDTDVVGVVVVVVVPAAVVASDVAYLPLLFSKLSSTLSSLPSPNIVCWRYGMYSDSTFMDRYPSTSSYVTYSLFVTDRSSVVLVTMRLNCRNLAYGIVPKL